MRLASSEPSRRLIRPACYAATGRITPGQAAEDTDMFGFFKKRPPDDPPTEKQRRYAAKLGIEVPPTMTKGQLSDLPPEIWTT